MPETRAAQRKRAAELAAGPPSDAWLPVPVQHLILDHLLQLLRIPPQPTNGLFVLPTGARHVMELQLVCKCWRRHIQYHPDALLSLRLHQLLRLSYLHDWVHFIVDSKSRAAKARKIPHHITLTYLHQTAPQTLSPPAAAATSHAMTTTLPATCQQGSSAQSVAAAASHTTSIPMPSTSDPTMPAHASDSPGSNSPPHSGHLAIVQLAVTSGKDKARTALGLPVSCCVLSLRLADTSTPASTLQALTAELQLLDQMFNTSLILTITVAAPTTAVQNATTQLSSRAPTDDLDGQAGVGPTTTVVSGGSMWRALLGVGGTVEGECARCEMQQRAQWWDVQWDSLSLKARLRGLALQAIAQHLAVECNVAEDGRAGTLWCIPTFSRINRRVPYDPEDPLGHLDL